MLTSGMEFWNLNTSNILVVYKYKSLIILWVRTRVIIMDQNNSKNAIEQMRKKVFQLDQVL